MPSTAYAVLTYLSLSLPPLSPTQTPSLLKFASRHEPLLPVSCVCIVIAKLDSSVRVHDFEGTEWGINMYMSIFRLLENFEDVINGCSPSVRTHFVGLWALWHDAGEGRGSGESMQCVTALARAHVAPAANALSRLARLSASIALNMLNVTRKSPFSAWRET